MLSTMNLLVYSSTEGPIFADLTDQNIICFCRNIHQNAQAIAAGEPEFVDNLITELISLAYNI